MYCNLTSTHITSPQDEKCLDVNVSSWGKSGNYFIKIYNTRYIKKSCSYISFLCVCLNRVYYGYISIEKHRHFCDIHTINTPIRLNHHHKGDCHHVFKTVKNTMAHGKMVKSFMDISSHCL